MRLSSFPRSSKFITRRLAIGALGWVAALWVVVVAEETQVLTPIVVSVARAPQPVDEAPLSVNTITADRLRNAAVVDIALREAPAFGLFRRTSSVSANPTAQGVSLRGIGPSGASRSLVLLDGVPLNDPFGGWVTWSAVPRMSLGAAQIIAGGGSSIWGSAALSGVVALESAASEGESGELRVEAGDFETVRAEAAAVHAVSGGFLRVDLDAFSTEGFYALAPETRGAVDRPFESEHQTAQIGWARPVGETMRAAVTARYFAEERGNGTAMQENATRAGFGSFALSGKPRHGFAWDAVAYAQRQSFESFFSSVNAARNAETPANDQFDVPASAAGVAFTANWSADAGARTTVGGDVRWVEGETREDFLFQSGRFTRRRFAGGEQFFAGVFVHHDRLIGERWRASADLRVDRWENADGHLREVDRASGVALTNDSYSSEAGTEVSPRLGLVWTAAPGWRVRGAAYRAFRVPTLNEYYRPFRVGTVNTLANSGLRKETLTGGELGMEVTRGAMNFEATGFFNELEDAVGNVTLSSAPGAITRQRQNLDTVRVRGVELRGQWRMTPALDVGLSYQWSEAEVTGARAQPSLVGRALAQAPEHKATASLVWDGPQRVRVRALVRYTSEQFDDDENQLVLREAMTADLQVERPIATHVVVFAMVENIFDERVVTSRSAAGLLTYDAPRWARGGVRWAW